jgi:hypothetical protein
LHNLPSISSILLIGSFFSLLKILYSYFSSSSLILFQINHHRKGTVSKLTEVLSNTKVNILDDAYSFFPVVVLFQRGVEDNTTTPHLLYLHQLPFLSQSLCSSCSRYGTACPRKRPGEGRWGAKKDDIKKPGPLPIFPQRRSFSSVLSVNKF